MNVPLLKPSAKDYFFKSVCVYLAYGELSEAKSKYETYTNEDPTILDTREDQFMKSAIEAVANNSQDEFKTAVSKYKTYTDFDKWKINVFKRILDKLVVELKTSDFLGNESSKNNESNDHENNANNEDCHPEGFL